MRKPSKMVLRAELEEAKAECFRAEIALSAILNGTASKAYRVAETVHQEGYPGNSYTFRFVQRGNGYDIAIVTFHCSTTGQKDSTRVHDVDAQLAYTNNRFDIWSTIWSAGYGQWRTDVYNAAKVSEVAA